MGARPLGSSLCNPLVFSLALSLLVLQAKGSFGETPAAEQCSNDMKTRMTAMKGRLELVSARCQQRSSARSDTPAWLPRAGDRGHRPDWT